MPIYIRATYIYMYIIFYFTVYSSLSGKLSSSPRLFEYIFLQCLTDFLQCVCIKEWFCSKFLPCEDSSNFMASPAK
jgi:hypothetical protein